MSISLISVLAAALAGALLFRLRGGWRPMIGKWQVPDIGTTPSRLVYWAIPVAVLVGATTLDPFLAARVVLEAWAGLALGWGSYQDLGRGPARDDESLARIVAWAARRLGNPPLGTERYDAIGLAIRGSFVTLPAGIDLALTGHGFTWLVAGIAMAPIYGLAWRVPSKLPGFAQGTGLGEALFGAWLGFSLVWSLR